MDKFLNALASRRIILRRGKLKTLQVNLGNLCNQSCAHCHIEAGPNGKEIMPIKVINDTLSFLSRAQGLTLDITGGAPELNPHLVYLIHSGRPLAKEIILRSNLTVLLEKGRAGLPAFLKEQKVHLVCSLPCYTKENVDRQRGEGVFAKSIEALRILNALGFGLGNGLKLDLVHNPILPNLAAPQDKLEMEYKNILNKEHGVSFNRLITITNVPIKRFRKHLEALGKYENYTELLENKFNPDTLENLMCRSLLSVGWDGRVFDCDFNLALGLELKDKLGRAITIDNLKALDLEKREILAAEHCFACSAGSGSSCQGVLIPAKGPVERDEVKRFYTEAALSPKKELCCPASYNLQDLSYIPKEVLEVSYGCGSPMSLAAPGQNEVVVDLGSGAGIDCFIAAKKVGAGGKVIGVDMTEDMLNKANSALERVAPNLGFLNCEFRLGFLEEVPVESESVDLVTSNCVLNLSPDKHKVFAEIYRILKNGGRFVISDIVAEEEVPAYMREDAKLWGECISGALTKSDFLAKAKEAGFYGLEILKESQYKDVEGIKFCSITLCGYKLKKLNSSPCCSPKAREGKSCC